MNTRKRPIPVLLLLLLSTTLYAAGPRARIAALEGNAAYTALAGVHDSLARQEEALNGQVEQVRRRFAADTAQRAVLADTILGLEERLFALRNRMGSVAERLGAIEQQWIVGHLDQTLPEAPHSGAEWASQPGARVRNLVDNAPFRELLPEADYRALQHAQRREGEALRRVNDYLELYARIDSLREAYATVTDAGVAAAIYAGIDSLGERSHALSDLLAHTWNDVFDNKLFAYNYLLDRLNCTDLLRSVEEAITEARQRYAGVRGQCASDALVSYCMMKGALVDCEERLAGLFGCREAQDSLREVRVQLGRVEYRLEPIRVEERYFLAYEPIGVAAPPRYNARNPIPDCEVYPHGTIYRILLGTFTVPQQPAIFRGVYPLAKLKGEDGKTRYFAGGFATEEEAVAARDRLRTIGFRRPEVVVWHDGGYTNRAQAVETTLVRAEEPVLYNVEIDGTEQLDAAVRTAIAGAAEGRDISRVGDSFVVGPFPSKEHAEKVVEAVGGSALSLRVVEVEPHPTPTSEPEDTPDPEG